MALVQWWSVLFLAPHVSEANLEAANAVLIECSLIVDPAGYQNPSEEAQQCLESYIAAFFA